MCEFHLKGNCFHPQKVQRGIVANSCNVHDCDKCTNKAWQTQKIREEFTYYNSLLKIAEGQDEMSFMEAPIEPIIEQEETSIFRNPFKLFRG